MKHIRTKDGIIYTNALQMIDNNWQVKGKERYIKISNNLVEKVANTIEELFDEIVLIENGDEHNIVYLQEAYDRIDEYHNQGNYEPRLIGRIKVGLDKKAVAEWKENEKGFYDWVLL